MPNTKENQTNEVNRFKFPTIPSLIALTLFLASCKTEKLIAVSTFESVTVTQIGNRGDLKKYTDQSVNYIRLSNLVEGCQNNSGIKQDIIIISNKGFCTPDQFEFKIVNGSSVFKIDDSMFSEANEVKGINLEVIDSTKAILIKPPGTLKAEGNKVLIIQPGQFSAGLIDIEKTRVERQNVTEI
jgi:hypothetical protein